VGPTIGLAPKQLAVARSGQPSLYALGGEGIQRIDLENTAPPPQAGADVDLVSLLVIGLMLAMVVIAVISRRKRRSAGLLGPTLDRPVRLHAKNGAQSQHQQPRRDQDLLIAHKAEREE
jgi:LPXTG-motif cell wall-anchored protein